jgi:Tfp pilus assembly protein PilZ
LNADEDHRMNVASLAQAARQSLARGLEALQARDAPPALIDVAQAVARAIGALVDLELSSDTPGAESVEAVLDALRDGLRLLQSPEYASHPAAARGMKAVAEAIGVVLTIARSARQRAPSPPSPPSPQPAPAPPAPSPPAVSMRPGLRSLAPASAVEPAVITRAVNSVMGPAPASIRLEASPARSEPAPMRPEPVPMKLEPVPAPKPEPVPAKLEPAPAAMKLEPAAMKPEPEPLEAAPVPIRPVPVPELREVLPSSPEPPMVAAATSPRVIEARTEATLPSARMIEVRAAALSRPPVAIRRDVVIERDLRAVDAPLGAHSPSNFYTGLAGGDVVASGGLFVATYQVPKVGEKVLLKISMPGGYEFVAKAKVAWTRDVATSLNPGSARGISGSPGFGAQFCEITDEGRRLIQRYVRNREPLFHEDAT